MDIDYDFELEKMYHPENFELAEAVKDNSHNIKLSYGSLNNLHNGHEWINKQMKIPVPAYSFLQEGKDAHRIIQDHVSGKKLHPYLKHIKVTFPTVEQKDFDEKCRFEFMITGGYTIFGYVDGYDPINKRILEIKTSSTPWSLKKFMDSNQRKLYANGMGYGEYKESYLITCSKNPDEWEENPPKVLCVPITKKDFEDSDAWIAKGIKNLEEGNFTGGLDENGKCTGCFWNMSRYPQLANCHFL